MILHETSYRGYSCKLNTLETENPEYEVLLHNPHFSSTLYKGKEREKAAILYAAFGALSELDKLNLLKEVF